jgi:hypothetical protein
MTDLRELVARGIAKHNPPTCDGPACSCAYECERADDSWSAWLDEADAAISICRDHYARVAEAKAVAFLSPEYATGQPMSSFSERFACGQVASAIRGDKT